ncbi:hypothetical protein [Alkaliphilus serpentinus]|uniref:hypothetical protein n=1 Tax=Alkaliphilus serpentinus TaxID=1482731 RepID=UPI00125DBDE0|nr:hypothetical protein [Alkaliphilus serpentinus]
MPLITTNQKFRIYIGSYGGHGKELSFWRVTVILAGWNLALGSVFYEKPLESKSVNILSIIGGPLVSLISFIVLFRLSVLTNNDDLYSFYRFFGSLAFYSFLFTTIPMKYAFPKDLKGTRSDGRRFLDLLFDKQG